MFGFVFGALAVTEINQDQRFIRQSGLFSQHSGSVVTALGEERHLLGRNKPGDENRPRNTPADATGHPIVGDFDEAHDECRHCQKSQNHSQPCGEDGLETQSNRHTVPTAL